ncbi:MAG: hypothetical protein ACODAJ_09925 [Planctomycetota bacterium]
MNAPVPRALSSRHAPRHALAAALCLWALVLATGLQAGEAPVAEQQRAHEAKVLVAHGRQLLASRAYAEAREAFAKALALNPEDEACARLLAQTERALGLGDQKTVLDQVKERHQATTHVMAVQFDHALFEAERELATHPDRAAQRAQKVLDGVAYLKDPERAADLKARAQGLLAKATDESKRRLKDTRRRELTRVKADARRRADARTARLRRLATEARRHLDAGNQEKALEAVEAMRRIDPENPQARELGEQVRRTRLTRASLGGVPAVRKERESELMRELDRELLAPEPGKVVVRGEKKPHTPGVLERPMEPWERELRAKLEEPVELEFRGTPLKEAVRQIADVAGVSVIVDPEAEVSRTPVDVGRSRMPAGSLLRWVGRFAGLQYQLRDGVVVLAKPGGNLDEPVRRSYDISSLVTPQNEAQPLPEVGPVEPASLTFNGAAEAEEVNPEVLGQGWVQYLRTTIAPGTWDQALQERRQYTIQYRNGRIVVLHTPEVQQEIEQLLNNFRRARNLQVHMLGRFIELTTAYLDAFSFSLADPDDPTAAGFTSEGTLDPGDDHWSLLGSVTHNRERGNLTRFPNFFAGGGGLSLQYNYLGQDDVHALLEAVVKKRKGTVLTAPRLTCFNTQRANIQVLVNYNYVRRVTTDDEPEIGNVPEGIIFDVQPFVSADRRYITLILQPQTRELVEIVPFHYSTEIEVIDTGDEAIGILQESFVQIPTTRLRSVGTTVTAPNGGTLLIGGFSEVEDRQAVAGIPFIEHVPLLGRVLRDWSRAEGRRSLIMLITAETVPDVFAEEY